LKNLCHGDIVFVRCSKNVRVVSWVAGNVLLLNLEDFTLATIENTFFAQMLSDDELLRRSIGVKFSDKLEGLIGEFAQEKDIIETGLSIIGKLDK